MASRFFRSAAKALRLGGADLKLYSGLVKSTRNETFSSFLYKPAMYGLLILGTAGLSFGYYTINYPPKQLPYDPKKKSIVVLGTGWGGATFIENLNTEEYNVTIISPKDYFVFTPLLPSFATGAASLASLIVDIRDIISYKKREVRFLKAFCSDVDLKNQTVTVGGIGQEGAFIDGSSIKYDYLVIATGTSHSMSNGVPNLPENSTFCVSDPSDCRSIKDKLTNCMEIASIKNLPEEKVEQLLSVVVAGGGPTGVEMASVVSSYMNDEVKKWYPHLIGKPKVVLIEAGDRVLPTLSPDASFSTMEHLTKKGIRFLTNTFVGNSSKESVMAETRDGSIVQIPCSTIITAMGGAPTALVTNILSKINDPRQDSSAGLRIDDHLRVIGLDNVYAIGDTTITSYPSTAQVASQQARYLASTFQKLAVLDEEKNALVNSGFDEESVKKSLLPPFRLKSKGVIVSLGPSFAVAQLPNSFVISNQLVYTLWKMVMLYNMKSASSRISYLTDTIRSAVFRTTLP